jgi:hypothetical protein
VSATSDLLWRLAAAAYGEDYPSEIQPWGGTTWWVLGRAICCRFVFTADEKLEAKQPSDITDWTQLISRGGLEVESKDEIPRSAEHLSAMYKLWLANLETLRADIGEQASDALRDEALTVGPTLGNR